MNLSARSQGIGSDHTAHAQDPVWRIGQVTPGFPPQLGGVETVVGHLADELARAGHRIAVYTQRPRGTTIPPADRLYTIHRSPDWIGHPEFRVAPGLLAQLWRDALATDVLHAHSFHAAPAMMAATVPRVPLVFTPHFHAVGHTRAAELVHRIYDPLARLIFRRSARITCVSHAEAELLLGVYPALEPRLSVIPHAVDTHALTSAEPFEVERPVVLVAGRLEPYKNVERVIRAFVAVRSDAQLIVCGDGSQLGRLREFADGLDADDRVRLLGPVSNDDVRRWQRTAHVTVSMSSREAFGLVLLEGAVAGGLVIASNIPAHREVQLMLGPDSDRILLVPCAPDSDDNEPRHLTDAIETALAQTRPNRPVGRAFDWTEVAAQYCAVYRTVV